MIETQSFIIIVMFTSFFIHSSYNIILLNFCSQYLFHISFKSKVSSFGSSSSLRDQSLSFTWSENGKLQFSSETSLELMWGEYFPQVRGI